MIDTESAKGLRPWTDNLYELHSLWEILMIPTRPHELFLMGAGLKESIVGHREVDNRETIGSGDRETGRKYYEIYEQDCFFIGLGAAQATCQRIQDLLRNKNSTYGDLRHLDEELFGRMRDELQSKRFYYILPDKARY